MLHIINGLNINAEEEIRGADAVVLLHYFGGSCREWRPVVAQTQGAYRFVAVDLRGHGQSQDGAADFGVGQMADDVAGLIAALGLERYVIVGHSMGGKVALELAARQPEGLAGLFLAAPSPPTPEPMSDDNRAQTLAAHKKRDAATQTVNKITVRQLAVPDFELAVEDNLQTGAVAWRSWLTVGSRENIAARMDRITVPVRVAVGSDDPIISPELMQKELLPRLRSATLAILPDVGHLSPLEAPELISEQLQAALMDML